MTDRHGLTGLRESFPLGGTTLPAPMWIIGPDVIEDAGFALEVAHAVAQVAEKRGLSLVFKASYEKANRSRSDSFRGPGIDVGLEVLAQNDLDEETNSSPVVSNGDLFLRTHEALWCISTK